MKNQNLKQVHSLEDWIKTILNQKEINNLMIKTLYAIPHDIDLTKEESMISALYFIITRKLYESFELSKRDILYIKLIKHDIDHLMKTVELKSNWIDLFSMV